MKKNTLLLWVVLSLFMVSPAFLLSLADGLIERDGFIS